MQQQDLIRVARRLRIIVIVAIAAIVAIYAASRLGLDLGHALRVERRSHLEGTAGAVAADIAVLLFVAALAEVVRLLGRLANGELFTPGVTHSFRRFALWLLVSSLISILGPTLASFLTPTDGGVRRIELVFDLREILFVVAALILFLVARVLDEAVRLEAELKEIV